MIELDRLSIGFPKSRGRIDVVVRDVSLSLAPGERIGVVGESGSGKSLTAMACLGLVPEPGRFVGGSVKIDGRDVNSMPRRALRKWRGGFVGFVFQEASTALNPVYTVGFQIEETVRCHRRTDRKGARALAVDLLGQVAIRDVERIRRAYPHELSGGLAQRVMLALALAGEPKILVADEPTSSLDTVTRAEILSLLDDLVRDRGLGLLLVSHDLRLVRDAVDRVVVMYGGEILEHAPTPSFFEFPLHPYSKVLLSATIGDPGGIPEGKQAAADQDSPDGGCVFTSRCRVAVPECAVKRPALIEVTRNHHVRCPVVVNPSEVAGEDA
jgi:oligopeptide/dipeptide ABC transporter ATP-binding protein